MPELPEVETVVRDLRPHLQRRRILSIWASARRLRLPWSEEWNSRVIGQTIKEVGRRGKWIVLGMSAGRRLVLHLGMTGHLTIPLASEPVASHTHLVFGLDNGQELRFRDVRRFGSARLFLTQAELDAFYAEAELGPEPFDLPAPYLREKFQDTDRNLKAILLDQRVLAGVGIFMRMSRSFKRSCTRHSLAETSIPRHWIA